MEGHGKVKVRVGGEQLVALAVVDDKGNVYDPPTHHRGREVTYPSIKIIATMGAFYLKALLKEASARLPRDR